MKPRRKPLIARLLQAVHDAIWAPGPAVVDNSLVRTRRLQRRVAREANRTPLQAPPRHMRGFEDRGFQ